MPSARTSTLSRRGLLAAGGALGLGAVLTACGGDDKKGEKGGADASGSASKGWSFKDDRGTDVTAKSTPKNIVAFVGTAAALFDFGVEVKGVFGPTKLADGKADVQAGSMDVSKLEILGNVWGEFNVEKYAALRPELLVTNMWVKDELWYVPAESKDKILKVGAPSVALWAGGDTTIPNAIARHAELAKSLGADLNAKKVTDAKARFEAAAERLRKAAKAKPGLKVLIGSGSADLFYVSVPKTSADTRYFQELGLTFVEPKANAAGFFEELSWENAGKYQADIIMLDNRTGTLQPKDLAAKPTWAKMPAVKAGQVIPRVTEPIFSYDKCAPVLEDLAKAVENAKKLS
ncbi:ABC transporter substrate-binding protein [Streptomyces sp. NPDC097619]|uniref:ABC transporter substrate-binding protein n=1 Tax=Streptomyces sp. NPDC097619 TaxID=3157228 RepID=UPI003317B00B